MPQSKLSEDLVERLHASFPNHPASDFLDEYLASPHELETQCLLRCLVGGLRAMRKIVEEVKTSNIDPSTQIKILGGLDLKIAACQEAIQALGGRVVEVAEGKQVLFLD